MKELRDILYKTRITATSGNTNIGINQIAFDSRKVGPGDLFIAVRGTQVDGHDYIDQAIEKGAAAIVCETIPESPDAGITYVKVKDSASALGVIASNFYDNPSKQLQLVGITGTNGKTTIATLLYDLFTGLGYPAALLSTIQTKITGKTLASTHTTPDALQVNKVLHEAVLEGCSHCFMEVSSHAVAQGRIAGLEFTGGIFTNITHDHLDYHKTFNKYLKAKQRFFDNLPNSAFALTNIDDRNGSIMVQNTRARTYTYGLKKPADFHGKVLENQFEGLQLNLDGFEFHSRLIGGFNAYNLLAVYACAKISGFASDEILTKLSLLGSVEGRFEYVRSEDNITGVIDYAHTPDALLNVLQTINLIRTGNESLITVVGTGGDRDRTKRAPMARIAGQLSNKVILTSDNPRSEDPLKIIDDMKQGIEPEDKRKFLIVADRREAIRTACFTAKPGDIILVAGKGHEKYQEIKGKRYPFDDKKILKELLIKDA